jgi:Ca2+-binding EF-hand superfamily protein
MTGGPPISGQDDMEILRLVKKGAVNYDEHIWKRVSPQALDFVKSLLTVDVEKRPSAVQALQQPWLRQFRAKRLKHFPMDRAVAKSAWEALLRFASYPLLKKAAWMIIAHNAATPEKRKLQQLFLYLDTDYCGELKYENFLVFMNEFAEETAISPEQLSEVFNIVDQDRTGFIHHMEFLSATIESVIKPTAKLIDQAFEHLDADSSTFISAENIHDLLGESYTLEDCKSILAKGFENLGLEPQEEVTRTLFFQMMEKVGLPSPFSTKMSPPKLVIKDVPKEVDATALEKLTGIPSDSTGVEKMAMHSIPEDDNGGGKPVGEAEEKS